MRHASFNPILSVLFQALLLYPLACKAQDKPKLEQSKTEQVGLPPADPKHAKLLIEQGKKEEAIGAFPEALQDYEAAARYAPFDVTIVAKAAALRSKLVHAYVESSERNALEGNLDAATMDLAMALHNDPSNAVVEERLQQMQSMRDGANTHRVVDEPPEGLARLEPDRKSVHSFNLRSDVKNAYEQVASAYGVKATFDPDLPARPVRFRVSDVDFDTAISILHFLAPVKRQASFRCSRYHRKTQSLRPAN
jgi:tetratricopeptide (TPR) repeat protein